jgi:hypothetical protein
MMILLLVCSSNFQPLRGELLGLCPIFQPLHGELLGLCPNFHGFARTSSYFVAIF